MLMTKRIHRALWTATSRKAVGEQMPAHSFHRRWSYQSVGGEGHRLAHIACVLGVAYAFGGGIAAAQDTGTIILPINGTVTFGDQCTQAMRDKVRATMDYLVGRLYGGSNFLTCAKDGILSETRGATPEQISIRLKDPLPTHIECKDQVCGNSGAAGCAFVGISTEELALKKDYILSASVPSLAGTIVHEVAHNKGWNHPPSGEWKDFNYRVPQQVQRCVASNSMYGLKRGQAPGETELAPSGGEGGQPFELACGPNQHVIGARVESSDRVNKLQLRCETGLGSATGSTKDSTRTIDGRCATNEIAVGIWGSHTDMLHQLGLFCAKKTDVAAAATTPTINNVWLGGSTNGVQFSRRCPRGMALTRVYGQSGARIDQVRAVCQRLDAANRGPNLRLALLGTKTGQSRGGHCLGNGVLIGLFGNAGAEVDKLGGICRPTRAQGIFGVPTPGASSEEHIIDALGGEGGNRFGDNCPNGQVLVGLAARSGARLDQIAGMCAEPARWGSTQATVPTTLTAARGGNTGFARTRQCARGSYLVGFEVWAKRTVHQTSTVQGLVPICRRLGVPQVFN
jgi:hypothetical protein